jgi:hypothetical protein
LALDGSEPCLVSDDYSRSELDAARDEVRVLEGTGAYVIEVDSWSTFNRVAVHVAVADRYTIRKIVEVVDDPGILRITADGAVIDG